MCISIPAMILSVISSFATSNSIPLSGSEVILSRGLGIAITMISFFSTFFLGLQNGFSLATKAEKHSKVATTWANLEREIKTILMSSRMRHNQDPAEILKSLEEKYKENLTISEQLSIPDWILDEYTAKFAGHYSLADIADDIERVSFQNMDPENDSNNNDYEMQNGDDIDNNNDNNNNLNNMQINNSQNNDQQTLPLPVGIKSIMKQQNNVLNLLNRIRRPK